MNDQRGIFLHIFSYNEDNAYDAEKRNMMRVFRPGAMSNTILKICICSKYKRSRYICECTEAL